jgi:hypothetical protein
MQQQETGSHPLERVKSERGLWQYILLWAGVVGVAGTMVWLKHSLGNSGVVENNLDKPMFSRSDESVLNFYLLTRRT